MDVVEVLKVLKLRLEKIEMLLGDQQRGLTNVIRHLETALAPKEVTTEKAAIDGLWTEDGSGFSG